MTTMITADQAARALIGASRQQGVDPLRVFEPDNVFVRQLAAGRCVRSGALSHLTMLARVFRIPNPVREPAGASA